MRFLEREWLRVCCARSEATWSVTSMRSSYPAVLSGVAGEMLAVVHWLVTRPLRCRRKCDGFRSPISSRERSCLTRFSREVDNRHTSFTMSRS